MQQYQQQPQPQPAAVKKDDGDGGLLCVGALVVVGILAAVFGRKKKVVVTGERWTTTGTR
jgi:hypothetical protein